MIQAEVFGRFEQIQEGAEVEVSGPIIPNMEPPLVVAERVLVLGSEPDYVLNLKGTVTAITPGKDGITAEVEMPDGFIYNVTISYVTSNISYIGEEKEIQVGSPITASGELFNLDGPHITADTVIVNPIPGVCQIDCVNEMLPGKMK